MTTELLPIFIPYIKYAAHIKQFFLYEATGSVIVCGLILLHKLFRKKVRCTQSDVCVLECLNQCCLHSELSTLLKGKPGWN